MVAEERRILTAAGRDALVEAVVDEALGLGPLEALLRDPDVTEVMVCGPGRVFVERAGRIAPAADAVPRRRPRAPRDRPHPRPLGRRVDEASPMVNARLPDGSRVNAVIPPLALDGPALTIRRFAGRALTGEDLVELGTIDRADARPAVAGGEGAAQPAGHGRHGQRQDHDARGARGLRAAGGAPRDDRGRRRAAHPAAPRRPPREPAAVPRGGRRGHDPGAGAQRPSHAARPHRGGRGPRGRGPRHADGDDHGARGVAVDPARLVAGRRGPPRADARADGRPRPPLPGGRRPGGERPRPDRPPGPPARRRPQGRRGGVGRGRARRPAPDDARAGRPAGGGFEHGAAADEWVARARADAALAGPG